MPYLKVENGPQIDKTVVLSQPSYVFGRHPDCDFVIDVPSASRQHFQVSREGNAYFVQDLNSRNHTYLNDEEVQARRPLSHGDRIRVCDVVFSFHVEQGAALPGRSSVEVDAATVEPTVLSSMSVMIRPEAKLKAVLDISKSLGKALSLDEVLPTVLDTLFRIFLQADRGFIGLLDEQGTLIPRWTKTRRDSDDTIRVSRTVIKKIIETKEAILSADAGSDAQFGPSQSIAELRIRSIMCAPLTDSEEKVLGVIQVDTQDPRKKFQPEDLEILVATATAAGIAIHNAQLHERAIRQQTLERDLQLAREVQRAFLPEARPTLPGYEFFDYYQPAHHIGGDYYDYIYLPDGRVAVIVADVVGHGIAAAMLMAKLSAEARFSLASETIPALAVNRLNDRLSRLQIDRFVTMVMVVLNPQTHEVVVVNAGHMAPIHHRVDRTLAEPSGEESGLPLGIIEGTEYAQVTFTLRPGESLTMYTDGINEASDKSGQEFSIERIREHVSRSNGGPEVIGDAVVKDVRSFLGNKQQDDDMCLVCLRRT